MSNTKSMHSKPRVLFMGMSGTFSAPPLLALLESGVDVCAVVLPARVTHKDAPVVARIVPPAKARSLPVLSSSLHTSIVQIAWDHALPVWEVRKMNDPQTHALYASFEADLYCVACFSLYIPRSILDLPRLGCLNVHPSLLPANRGPDPLFWTFHQGTDQTGVTIHMMDEGLDTGPIVAQEPIIVPESITYAQLEARCAELGGRLLVRSAWELHRGTATKIPQDESRSYYLPSPTPEDYIVQAAEWPVQRVYRFIKGVASREQPITLQSEGQAIQAIDAISYSREHAATLAQEQVSASGTIGRTMFVACRDGWVEVIKA